MTSIPAKFRLVLTCILLAMTAAFGQEDITDMDLSQLVTTESVQLTSVAKTPKERFSFASAAYVIDSETIRRSGYTNVPDLLRLVPGFHVARLGSSDWNVATRGFGGSFLNKLLVLIDGRSVYNPVTSGVFWNTASPPIEDIERIELIRGPGAVLWGLNAMNGIINIVTRNSKDTRDTLVSLGGGSFDLGSAHIRQGVTLSTNSTVRLFSAFNLTDQLELSEGQNPNGNWAASRSGFRFDQNSDFDVITLQSEFATSRQDVAFIEVNPPGLPDQSEIRNTFADQFNILGRWSHTISPESNITGQTFFDYTNRAFYTTEFSLYNLDAEFHHNIAFDKHDFVWGAGARLTEDDISRGAENSFSQLSDTMYRGNVFVQDSFKFCEGSCEFTVGTKFSYNNFTEFEYQPGARLGFKLNNEHFIWLATTRAIRTPSRYERSAFNLTGAVADIFKDVFGGSRIVGNRNIDSERLHSFEIGYRGKLTPALNIDIATYYNEYDRLTSVTVGSTEPVLINEQNVLITSLQINNGGNAKSYGGELELDWQPLKSVSLSASYSLFKDSFKFITPNTAAFDITTPKHMITFRGELDLSETWELDLLFRHADAIDVVFSAPNEEVNQVDIRLGWNPVKNLQVSLSGFNLLGSQKEYVDPGLGTPPLQTFRSIYAKAVWSY